MLHNAQSERPALPPGASLLVRFYLGQPLRIFRVLVMRCLTAIPFDHLAIKDFARSGRFMSFLRVRDQMIQNIRVIGGDVMLLFDIH